MGNRGRLLTGTAESTLREAVVFWLQHTPVPGDVGTTVFYTGSGWTGGALYRSSGAPTVRVPTLREAIVAFLLGAETPAS